MATSLSEQRAIVLSTTADYIDFENDQANIRAGMRTQQAITNRQKWQSYFSPNAHKRARLSPEDDLRQVGEKIDPQLELSFRRNRLSLPIRIVHRLTNKDDAQSYDPNTIPVITKRDQRRFEKRERRQYEKNEKRKLDELEEQRRKLYFDQISRQLEVNERERQANLPYPPARRSVKDKVKATIKKSTKITRTKAQSTPPPLPNSNVPQYIPHVDDFESKSQLRSWFGPSDVEALHTQPAQTIAELPPAAELPAVSISPPYDYTGDFGKRRSDDSIDLDTLPPPPIRSPSPCLSSIPRRGYTLSETPHKLCNKQMQCDYCHDAIKLAGYHYACKFCDPDDERLYCAKCANDGRTCRHALDERTRNIKRHPTNPQPSHHHQQQQQQERKAFSLDKDQLLSTDAHAELSASPPLPGTAAPSATIRPSTEPHIPPLRVDRPTEAYSLSTTSPTDVYILEAKIREQEFAFREKEMFLREREVALREAGLREREIWATSREREAALVQHFQTAALLQRGSATEVGAQFMSGPSRHSSRSSHLSCFQADRSEDHGSFPNAMPCQTGPSPNSYPIHHRHHNSLHNPRGDDIRLHSSGKGKKPNIELVSAVAALEASVAGIEIAEPALRSHANSAKRKASSPEAKSSSKSSGRKGQGSSRRSAPRKNNQRHDPDDHDESEGSDEGSPKRQKQTPVDQQDKKLFACPYFKYEPMRYAEGNTHELHYRGCAGGLYRDISRVKQHLKRVHHRPDFYCRRCFSVFDTNEELQEHSSQEEGCDAETCPFPEKLDETQQNKIHVKRPGKDPKDLWYDIFRIIFPGVPVPNSPYIEAAQPKSNEQSILEQFVRLFEAKLDTSVSSQSWLSSTSAREFIRAQMRQTMQETIRNTWNQASAVPSLLVSPVSPPEGSQFPDSRQGSRSSRASSSAHSADVGHSNQPPLLSPISPISSLRPALKVKTHGTQGGSSSSESPLYSAKSQNSSQFPVVPRHVQDDLEREHDVASSSWQSGDDVHAMNGTVQEPASATSTRSGKSVTFATPPPFVTAWRETNEPPTTWSATFPQDSMPADMSYFTNFDWPTENFAANNGYFQPGMFKQQQGAQRADSGYGTLSSHASRSSMFQAQNPGGHHSQQCQAMCVDPQVLFVNPTEAGVNMPGISDLQAYLNRKGCFPYQ